MRKIKELCPIWTPFIDNWYELVRRYESNEKMYEYISELVEQGRLKAGWIRTSPNSWKMPINIGGNGRCSNWALFF